MIEYNRAVAKGEILKDVGLAQFVKQTKDFEKAVLGTQAQNGIIITSVSDHAVARSIGNSTTNVGVPFSVVTRVLQNPEKIVPRIVGTEQRYAFKIKGLCNVVIRADGRIVTLIPKTGNVK